MNVSKTLTLAAVVAILSGTSGVVRAAPVTYDFTSGFITLSADVGSTDLLPAGTEIQLTGGHVTFDAVALTLPSFQFLDNVPKTVALNTTGALAGESITLASLNVVPDASYTSSAFGSNPYGFTAGQIDASGTYSLGGPLKRGNTAFSGTNKSLNGQVTLGGSDTIQLTGITLGTFTMGTQTIVLTGDIVFEGATPVPLPPAGWLLIAGLAFLGFRFAGRRPASSNTWILQS